MTVKATRSPLPSAVQEARRLVDAAEALGHEHAGVVDAIAATTRAFDALRQMASEELVPSATLSPASAAALMDFADLVGNTPALSLPDALVRALAAAQRGAYPDLVSVIVGPRGGEAVQRAADLAASRLGLSPASAGGEYLHQVEAMRQQFVAGVARVCRADHPEAASVILEALPELEQRLESLTAKRAAHVVEREAAAAKIKEAEATTVAAADERAMLRFFRARANTTFMLGPYFNNTEHRGSAFVSAIERGQRQSSQYEGAIRLWTRAKRMDALARQILAEEMGEDVS